MFVLSHTARENELIVAQRIQNEIRNFKIIHSQSDVSDYVTLSMGVSCTIPKHDYNAILLVKETDKALYKVKINCRNNYLLKNLTC